MLSRVADTRLPRLLCIRIKAAEAPYSGVATLLYRHRHQATHQVRTGTACLNESARKANVVMNCRRWCALRSSNRREERDDPTSAIDEEPAVIKRNPRHPRDGSRIFGPFRSEAARSETS